MYISLSLYIYIYIYRYKSIRAPRPEERNLLAVAYKQAVGPPAGYYITSYDTIKHNIL